ncbi:MAG: hypothetical protein Q4P18_01370 [Methanobrevibacter sp.]|uniref:hypothetical protein n=1 Tax=Methanobrevibacter sp. TaxID=66852 RepID=UPI0026DF1C3B|nr:hypothetical protein [Methanobrevibacter sp.]MDO5848165.1 hypothetical protein [Methanobrevibacter sp.]
MECQNHPGRESTKTCDICGKSICDECSIELAGQTYCKDCLENIVGGSKKESTPEPIVKEQSISETIQEMDNAYANNEHDYFEEPQAPSFKSEIPNRENILEDVLGNDSQKSMYSQYDEPQFASQSYSEPQTQFDFNEPINSNPYDINPKVEESYYAPKDTQINPYQENVQQNNFDDGFIYPDHTYEPPEIQGYHNEPNYDSYLDDLYFDEPNIPLSEQLAKDEENFGSLTKNPYEPVERTQYAETIYEPVDKSKYTENMYEQQYVQNDPYAPNSPYQQQPGELQRESFLDINNVTYNNPQGDYIPPRQHYPQQNEHYGQPSIRQGPNDAGMRPSTRSIRNIPTEKQKEPIGAVDILLTIILIILIIVVVFYIVYIFLLSSSYPTFLDAIYGLSNPSAFFSNLIGK